MKAILVGAGGMGVAWAKTLRDHPITQIAAWVDVRPGAAKDAASRESIEVEFTGQTLTEAIQAVKADFVVDVTPPEAHCQVVIEALSAGLPVLGEKPMASSLVEAKRMLAASEAAGKLYMVSQSRRYNRQLYALQALINDEIGGCGILNADFYIGAHFGGFRDEMPSPLILDMAIHTFDEARFLSGADPVAVYAEEFNPGWSWYKGDACASAIFEMSNGLRFTYRGSWCAEGLHTSWDADWRAVGPRGTATWLRNTTPTAEVVEKTEGFHSQMKPLVGAENNIEEGIKGSLAEFLSALATGKKPQGECHDNIKSLAMVFGAIESARTKSRVQIAGLLA